MESNNPPTEPGQQSYDTGSQPTDPDAQRAWLEAVDRKLSTRTYIGAAAAVLALAAAIVAIVLSLDASNNSASKGDVKSLQQEIGVVAKDASGATDAQENIDSLSGRVDTLQDSVDGASSSDEETQKRLDVIEDDIEDLRQQVSDLESSDNSGGSSPGSNDG